VQVPVASVDVHTFMTVPPEHDAPFAHVVLVPLPPLLLELPLPLLPDPLAPSHAAAADAAADVQSVHELHAKDWPLPAL
jgi:hypothetical protein